MYHILFICSANKDRSKTAEDYFSEKFPGITFNSAGTNQKICDQYGTNFVTEDMLDEVDHIYVMEEKHREFIRSNFKKSYSNKITVLKIEDIYTYDQPELINILEEKIGAKMKSLVD